MHHKCKGYFLELKLLSSKYYILYITQIRKKQDFINSVLKAKKIEFEEIDISDAANEHGKSFMRENSKAAREGANILPPQIFNNSIYCGVSGR